MNKEIERKYLVIGEFKDKAVKSYRIAQGFLSTVPERTVRVRIRDNKGFITVKTFCCAKPLKVPANIIKKK